MAARSTPRKSWSDARLVKACLDGDERAWDRLVDKYKNLLFAILLRRGLDRAEAADLFQAVWLEAYRDLPKLRDRGALKPWLVSLAHHKAYHSEQRARRRDQFEIGGVENPNWADPSDEAPAYMEELEHQQQVREAVWSLPERCREMIRMLFYEIPPLPYKEVAQRLGLATGSIGFIRGRCLDRLKRTIEKLGLA